MLAADTPRGALILGVGFLAGFLSQLVMFMAPLAFISFQRYTTTLQIALMLAAYLILCHPAPNKLAGKLAPAATVVLACGSLANLFIAM